MKKNNNLLLLYLFSIVAIILTYGFALTNFSLTPDSESPIFSDYSMGLGRWGTNLIRYHLFNGLLPYYTLLFGLIFLSLTAVEITKILNIKGINSYLFCLLFLSFPQHSYQLAFTMQADAVPLGYFLGTLSISFFIKRAEKRSLLFLNNILSIIFIVLTIAIYQALVFIPIVLYILYFFVQISNPESILKLEFKKALYFIALFVVSVLIYYISVKLLCPPIEGGYLASYTSGPSSNRYVDFYNLLIDNAWGDFYYGDKPYIIATISILLSLLILFFKKKGNAILKSLVLFSLLIIPFIISFFITNGSHPPRLYVASTLVFAFSITHILGYIPSVYIKYKLFFVTLIFLWNNYYIANLFYSSNKIFTHDLEIAKNINKKIDDIDDFKPETDYVYFYGALPMNNYDRLILPKSDIFSGSLFRWDGGNNWRIINFFRFNDVAYYRFLDDENTFNQVKDSIKSMPTWPNKNAIKKINNVVIIKLGDEKGCPLPFEN